MAKAWKADRRLYLNADKTKVIECKADGSPGDGAAFLLCAKGSTVPPATVQEFKLKDKLKPAKPKAAKPAEDKGKKPAANKAAK